MSLTGYCIRRISDSHLQQHDVFTDVLTAGLCIGLVVSYLPQVRATPHLALSKAHCRSSIYVL